LEVAQKKKKKRPIFLLIISKRLGFFIKHKIGILVIIMACKRQSACTFHDFNKFQINFLAQKIQIFNLDEIFYALGPNVCSAKG